MTQFHSMIFQILSGSTTTKLGITKLQILLAYAIISPSRGTLSIPQSKEKNNESNDAKTHDYH